MNRDSRSTGMTTASNPQPADMEFDQWAKAVRKQMVDALKRRGNG